MGWGGLGGPFSAGAGFTGGVTNSGLISAGNLTGGPIPLDPAIFVANFTSFSGGIINASGGVISAKSIGVAAGGISTFSGGIFNRGTIAAGAAGVAVLGGLFGPGTSGVFTGGISNTGQYRPGVRRGGCLLVLGPF